MTAPATFNFDLGTPVEVGGATVASLKVRPPTAADVLAIRPHLERLAADPGGFSASVETALALLGRCAAEGADVVEALDFHDVVAVANAAFGEGGAFHACLARAMNLAGALHRTQPPRRGRRH